MSLDHTAFRIASLAGMLRRAVALCIGALFSINAVAEWPDKPIKLLVGYAPGGGVDLVGRTVAQALSGQLGQSVFVENKAGASTAIAAVATKRAQPDGYTFMLISNTNVISPALSRKPLYDLARDFTTIVMVARAPVVLVVAANSPYKSIADLVAVGQKQPGGINFSGGGSGTVMHLAGLMLKDRLKVPMTHIPFKGGGEAVAALLSFDVQLQTASAGNVIPLIGDKLRALAVTSSERSDLLPGVPTLKELGIEDFEVTAWYAIAGPRNIPDAIVNRMAQAVQAALREKHVQTTFKSSGIAEFPGTSADAKTFVAGEIRKWGSFIQSTNLAGQDLDQN